MKITLPLSITIPRKTKADKVFALNLNVYRNAHHMTLNQSKIIFKGVLERLIAKCDITIPPLPHCCTYTIFPANGRVFDLGNVCSIIQKYTEDALQELGIIENDNYKHIRSVRYEFGSIDKENPRCELEITTDKTLCNVRTLDG
jgi:hypothetical protein